MVDLRLQYGQYEIKDPGSISCILVHETDVQKVTQ